MANENVLCVLQEAVRSAILEAANEEIRKCEVQFEIAMQRARRGIVNRLVNEIQITASQNLPGGEYVIQIRLNGGKHR